MDTATPNKKQAFPGKQAASDQHWLDRLDQAFLVKMQALRKQMEAEALFAREMKALFPSRSTGQWQKSHAMGLFQAHVKDMADALCCEVRERLQASGFPDPGCAGSQAINRVMEKLYQKLVPVNDLNRLCVGWSVLRPSAVWGVLLKASKRSVASQ